MGVNQILKVGFFAFVFLFAFSLGAQAVTNQMKTYPYEDYSQEAYGVNSIEELSSEYEYEAWLNYTKTNSLLYTNQLEWLSNSRRQTTVPWNGTSTYEPVLPQQEVYPGWTNLGSPNAFVELSVFSMCGLFFLSVLMIPKTGRKLLQRKWLITMIIVLFMFSGGFIVGKAVAQSLSIDVEKGVKKGASITESSYIISKDDSAVIARDQWGKIAYSGSDASAVINNVISGLSTQGRRIFVKDGVYEITSSIVLPSNIFIEAESWNTIFKLKNQATFHVFTNSNTTNGNDHIIIRGFNIDMNSANQGGNGFAPSGIRFVKVRSSIIENNYIHDVPYGEPYGGSAGIEIYAYGTEYSKNLWIGNFIENAAYMALSPYAVRGDIIAFNQILNAHRGIYLDTTHGSTIYGNSIYHSYPNPNSIGIRLYRYCDQNSILSNVVDNFPYGIELTGTQNNENLIMGNTIRGAVNPVFVKPASNMGNIIRSNIGFNPVGVISLPLETTSATIGLEGDESVPVANTDYIVAGVDIFITSSGGTDISITIKDQNGNVVAFGLATLTAQFLPIGYKINFGAFTSAPTVTVSGN